jgi:hypothetical protein
MASLSVQMLGKTDATRIESVFGVSKGKAEERMALMIEGFGLDQKDFFLAISRKKPTFSGYYVAIPVTYTENGVLKSETVWTNRESFRKRFSKTEAGITILAKFLPQDAQVARQVLAKAAGCAQRQEIQKPVQEQVSADLPLFDLFEPLMAELETLKGPVSGTEFRRVIEGVGPYMEATREEAIAKGVWQKRKQRVVKALNSLKKPRKAFDKANALPIYQPRKGQLPSYRTAPIDEYAQAIKLAGIPVEVVTKLESSPTMVMTSQKLDEAVQSFASQSIFPWDSGDDGCYARASIMRDQLLLMGVPSDHIKRVYLVAPQGKGWVYHVALSVRVRDANGQFQEKIIDPLYNKEKALTREEWIGNLKKSDRHEIAIEGNVTSPKSKTHKKDRFAFYTSPHDMVLKVKDDAGQKVLKFRSESEKIRLGAIKRLRDIQIESDILAIDTQLQALGG